MVNVLAQDLNLEENVSMYEFLTNMYEFLNQPLWGGNVQGIIVGTLSMIVFTYIIYIAIKKDFS
jgi:hypothetical protein